jgi:hypothetical protein
VQAVTGSSGTLAIVTTKAIRSPAVDAHIACDVCGRTLLRGERAHPYLDGGVRRAVCELCTARAHQEGWIREGSLPAYAGRESASDRRRSLFGRLRRRRNGEAVLDESELAGPAPALTTPPAPQRRRAALREPRHVRAVPASPGHRIATAIAAFNSSEHPRTVAGVARSLGLPGVSVTPVSDRPSVVRLVVAWELCWYRYEVDLADEDEGVRLADQGSELDELSTSEREPNAVCDDSGSLALPA